MSKIIAKKTLICDLGVECFTKGKEYEVGNFKSFDKITENSWVLNNQGMKHFLGCWNIYFKIKK